MKKSRTEEFNDNANHLGLYKLKRRPKIRMKKEKTVLFTYHRVKDGEVPCVMELYKRRLSEGKDEKDI